MTLRLVQQLDHLAQTSGDHTAVRDRLAPGAPWRTITWQVLRDAAARLASRLRDALEPGDVLIVALPNRAEFHGVFMAGLMAELCVFPLAPTLTRAELRDAAERAVAVAVIGPAAVCDALADRVALGLDIDTLDVFAAASPPPQAAAFRTPVDASLPGPALRLHSAGAAALPRIVHRSGASLDAVADNCAQAIGLTADDRVLAVAPLCHSYGLEHGLLMPLIAGAAVELPAATDPHTLMRELIEREATTFPAVPFIYEAMVMLLGGESRKLQATSGKSGEDDRGAPSHFSFPLSDLPPDLPHLKRAYSAGGPLPRDIADAFHDRFGVRLGQVFGSTEVGSVTYGDPDSPDFDPASVGRAMRGVDLRIVSRDVPDVSRPLPIGETGQLAVAAPSMLHAYADRAPGSDDPPDLHGYCLTGDLARLDAHGNLHLTGRIRRLVNVGGRKVNPVEVETVLVDHPQVGEAAVLPLAVTQTFSRLRAIVAPRPGVSESEIDPEDVRRFVRERLSSYKIPRLIEVRRNLPRSATGKIPRETLK